MKKYFLAIGLVAFLMTSCCDKQEEKANCKQSCKDKKEQCDKHHHECDHHGEKAEMCPKMMACMDQMVEGLANWENLDETQKAELIDMAKKIQEMKANMPKPDCCKEGKHEGCEKHKGKCEGKHECKHGEGHKCDHKDGKKCDGNHENCNHNK